MRIAFLLFLFNVLLRLALISKGAYHSDCLYLALQAEATVRTHQLHLLHSHGYPLTALLGSAAVWLAQIFGEHDPVRTVHLMSVIFGAMSVVLLYRVTSQLFDPKTGLFTAILFSFSPIFRSNFLK